MRVFPAIGPLIRGLANLQALAAGLGLDGPGDLASPALGTAVTTARSSWVRLISVNGKDYYVKTYDYPSWKGRWRGALRNTGPLRASRAAREGAALDWLVEHGFSAPPVVGWQEQRHFGFVTRAILVTGAWPGRPCSALLPELAPPPRQVLATAMGAFVGRLHRAGFRDGNLDLRNLLARPADGSFELTKIDSPRFRLAAPGEVEDRGTRADWSRLLPQLEPFDLAAIVRAAARSAPASAPT